MVGGLAGVGEPVARVGPRVESGLGLLIPAGLHVPRSTWNVRASRNQQALPTGTESTHLGRVIALPPSFPFCEASDRVCAAANVHFSTKA